MHVGVLGPVEVHDGDQPIDLGTPRQRAIVAALALSRGRAVTTDGLVERVWGPNPPKGVIATLHSYIGTLRRALEPDRAPREPATILVTEGDGYALRTPSGERDDVRLEVVVASARGYLRAVPDHLRPAVAAADADDVEACASALDDVLASWRGTPYPELGADLDTEAERTRLHGLRTAAQELWVVALLALGRQDDVLPMLGLLASTHPLHERWWALHALALSRSGRQAEALATLQVLRSALAEELGVDPGDPVRELQTAILRQDPSVSWSGASPITRRHEPDDRTKALDETDGGHTGRTRPTPPRWPLSGRQEELDSVLPDLDQALDGRPVTVLVTGEAGIGKTRLVDELAGAAYEQGFTVVTGQCSLDGPPPLWPWQEVLTSIARQVDGLPDDALAMTTTGAPEDFALWDRVARTLLDVAAATPLLVVLEDIHWAHPATLGLLRHLRRTTSTERLCVVATLRVQDGTTAPELDAFMADLARSHARRVNLSGLPLEEAADLVRSIQTAPSEPVAVRDWWRRSAGNPFYLSELVLGSGALSGSLTDVVLARVRELPPGTMRALEAASVIDLAFDLDMVARVLDTDLATTAATLEPALAHGLVLEAGQEASRYRFAHGVVREAVHDAQTQAARADWHRDIARVLDRHSGLRRADQRAALAHHWRLAGPAHSREGWRSVVRAAETARAVSAYDEEAGHLADALTWQEADARSTDRERFELLMMRAEACGWAGDWQGTSDCVDEAVLIAERLGDPGMAARAVQSAVGGALWQVRPYGVVHQPIVETLERILQRLPAEHTSTRCRTLLALATELYYAGDVERVDDLVAEALTLADDEDDPRLSATAHLAAFIARSRPDTAEERLDYTRIARAAAEKLDDPRVRLLVDTLAASVAGELGDATAIWRDVPGLLDRTRTRGLATAEVVLHSVNVPWLAMAGDDTAAASGTKRLEELAGELRMPNVVEAAMSNTFVSALHAGTIADMVPFLDDFAASSRVPAWRMAITVLLRVGEVERARRTYAEHGDETDDHTFMSLLLDCLGCEIALGLDEPEIAEPAYRRSLPYAGRMCSAGSAVALGPVDLFLAQGAAARGDRAAATAHADAAAELARAWRIPRIGQFLDTLRARHGF